jgi:hypothetical protein
MKKKPIKLYKNQPSSTKSYKNFKNYLNNLIKTAIIKF